MFTLFFLTFSENNNTKLNLLNCTCVMWIFPFLRSEVTKSIESIRRSNLASSIPNLTEAEMAFENAYFSKIRTSSGSSGLKKTFKKNKHKLCISFSRDLLKVRKSHNQHPPLNSFPIFYKLMHQYLKRGNYSIFSLLKSLV